MRQFSKHDTRMHGRMPISMDRARGIIMFMYEKPATMANLLSGAENRF